MIVTDAKKMKEKCSSKGWNLFIQHRLASDNESPNDWSDDTQICLNRVEALQYEYEHEQ